MKKRDKIITIVLIIFSAICAWSSLFETETVSLIDYSIRDKNNEMVAGEKVAFDSPVDHSNPLVVNVKMSELNKNNLLAIINISEKIKEFFAERGIEIDVASLATITDYKGESLEKFISVSKITDPGFNPGVWFWQNAYRLTLEKSFLGKTKDYYYSSITLFPKQGVSEMEVDKTFLLFKAGWHDYQTDWWKNLDGWNWDNINRYARLSFHPTVPLDKSLNRFEVKDDSGKFHLVSSNVSDIELEANGWTFLRLDIDANSRMGAYLSLSLAILVAICFSYAVLGTWKKVFTCFVMIGLMLNVGKGITGIINSFIGLVNNYFMNVSWLSWLANDFFQQSYEDVFTILSYFSILIAGISFPWHYMRKFGYERKKYPHAKDYWLCWDEAKKKVSITVWIVFIAATDFILALCFPNFNAARALWQVGLVSSVGIVSAWLFTNYFLPIFYFWIGGVKDSHKSSQSKASKVLENRIRAFVIWSISNWSSKKWAAILSLVFLVGVVYGAIKMSPHIETDNNLESFLKNSPSEGIYKEMNDIGGSGSTMFTPFVSLDLYDARALDELRLYLEGVAKESRMTYSPLYFFIEVIEEDYGYKIGSSIEKKLQEEAVLNLEDYGEVINASTIDAETREIVKSIWGGIMDEDNGILDHFISLPDVLNPGHVEVVVSSADSSTRKLIDFRDNTLNANQSKEIKVYMAGKLSQYLEIDQIISNNRWSVIILSQLVVVFFCILYFWWRNEKSKASKWRVAAVPVGVLVAIPFIFATAGLYLLIVAIDMPLDIATTSISAMAVAIALDFPLFVADFFRRVIITYDQVSKKDVFTKALNDPEMINAIVDVIMDFMGSAIMFSLMMVTPVETIRRVGELQEAVLFLCIFSTVFMVLPMMRWTIRGNRDGHIFRELFSGKRYGQLGRNHALGASG